MLPVIVALAHHQPLLGPDDLRPDRKAALGEAFGNDGGAERSMPDVSNFAGEKVPGRGPIRYFVVTDFSLSRGAVDTAAVTPFRIVFDILEDAGEDVVRHSLRHAAGTGTDLWDS